MPLARSIFYIWCTDPGFLKVQCKDRFIYPGFCPAPCCYLLPQHIHFNNIKLISNSWYFCANNVLSRWGQTMATCSGGCLPWWPSDTVTLTLTLWHWPSDTDIGHLTLALWHWHWPFDTVTLTLWHSDTGHLTLTLAIWHSETLSYCSGWQGQHCQIPGGNTRPPCTASHPEKSCCNGRHTSLYHGLAIYTELTFVNVTSVTDNSDNSVPNPKLDWADNTE